MVGNETNPDSAKLETGEPMRVIVADDDPFARRMIKESLQRAGVIVVAEAPDGRQAVELAVFYRPDVVLMDVVMPEPTASQRPARSSRRCLTNWW